MRTHPHPQSRTCSGRREDHAFAESGQGFAAKPLSPGCDTGAARTMTQTARCRKLIARGSGGAAPSRRGRRSIVAPMACRARRRSYICCEFILDLSRKSGAFPMRHGDSNDSNRSRTDTKTKDATPRPRTGGRPHSPRQAIRPRPMSSRTYPVAPPDNRPPRAARVDLPDCRRPAGTSGAR